MLTKMLSLRFSTFVKCTTITSFKSPDIIHQNTSSQFRVQTDTHVPCRGIRGAKGRVLHKEVIDKYKIQRIRDFELGAQPGNGTTGTVHSDPDMPVTCLENPYEKPQRRCLLCVQDVDLDYKNSRLLSQFVSPHTGQIYGRQITGLCLFMQKRVSKLIKRSQFFGFMPYVHKDPRFLKDPKLFDPFRRKS